MRAEFLGEVIVQIDATHACERRTMTQSGKQNVLIDSATDPEPRWWGRPIRTAAFDPKMDLPQTHTDAQSWPRAVRLLCIGRRLDADSWACCTIVCPPPGLAVHRHATHFDFIRNIWELTVVNRHRNFVATIQVLWSFGLG